MKPLKVLNLYAGIGGNRKLWENVEVTAVEKDPRIAAIYQEQFPEDKVVVDDAHDYLINNYKLFEFIWGSRPCPPHSRARFWGWHDKKPIYPDFMLYEEIVFLEHHFDGKYAYENVIPYYKPLLEPTAKIGRHLFWANFRIAHLDHQSSDIRKLSGTSWNDKLERNKVDSEIGLHILNCARNIITKSNTRQGELFNA